MDRARGRLTFGPLLILSAPTWNPRVRRAISGLEVIPIQVRMIGTS
jgi:hypothetical protein